MPPPEPRSSTVSPWCRSATAVGVPQPRLASRAASGSWSRSGAAYSSAPNPGSSAVEGGDQATKGAGTQRVVGPGAALLALQQPGIHQLLEVVADGRLAQAEGPSELTHVHRPGAGGQQVDDLDPVGVGQGLEQPGRRLGLIVRQRRRPQGGTAGRYRGGRVGR